MRNILLKISTFFDNLASKFDKDYYPAKTIIHESTEEKNNRRIKEDHERIGWKD